MHPRVVKFLEDEPTGRQTIIDVSAPHHMFGGRISAVAASPNMVYVGTVAGEIEVIGRVEGEPLKRRWDQEQRPIEGIMFDNEGKIVYATEMNLVIVDADLTKQLKDASKP